MSSDLYRFSEESKLDQAQIPDEGDIITLIQSIKNWSSKEVSAALDALYASSSIPTLNSFMYENLVPVIMQNIPNMQEESIAKSLILLSTILPDSEGAQFGAIELLHFLMDKHPSEGLILPILMFSERIMGYRTKSDGEINPVEFLVSFFKKCAQVPNVDIAKWAFKAAKKYLTTGCNEYIVLQQKDFHSIAFDVACRMDESSVNAIDYLSSFFYNHPLGNMYLPPNYYELITTFLDGPPEIFSITIKFISRLITIPQCLATFNSQHLFNLLVSYIESVSLKDALSLLKLMDKLGWNILEGGMNNEVISSLDIFLSLAEMEDEAIISTIMSIAINLTQNASNEAKSSLISNSQMFISFLEQYEPDEYSSVSEQINMFLSSIRRE